MEQEQAAATEMDAEHEEERPASRHEAAEFQQEAEQLQAESGAVQQQAQAEQQQVFTSFNYILKTSSTFTRFKNV